MSSSKTTISELGGKGVLPKDSTACVYIPKMGDTSGEMYLVGPTRWVTHKMDSTYNANPSAYGPGNEKYLNFRGRLYQDEVIIVSATHQNVFTMLGKQNSYNAHVKLTPWQEDLNNFLEDVHGNPGEPYKYDGMVFNMMSSGSTSNPYSVTFYWTGF